MTLSKDILQDKIDELEKNYSEQTEQLIKIRLQGKIEGVKYALAELIKPPQKKPLNSTKSKKDFDMDKGFENIVKFYIEKKNYTKEQANDIAIKCMTDQKQKRL